MVLVTSILSILKLKVGITLPNPIFIEASNKFLFYKFCKFFDIC